MSTLLGTPNFRPLAVAQTNVQKVVPFGKWNQRPELSNFEPHPNRFILRTQAATGRGATAKSAGNRAFSPQPKNQLGESRSRNSLI